MSAENFFVEFFETDSGSCPVEDFLDALDDKTAAKVYGMIGLLEEYGNALRAPYSKHLDSGIFELRCNTGANAVRVLYFFFVGKKIILTNGFLKKTQKTPASELELAKKCRDIYVRRKGARS